MAEPVAEGCAPRPDWLAATVPNAANADFCIILRHILGSDLRCSCQQVLPACVEDMHGVALPGCYLLQVDEALDISAPARLRYQPNAASGTRKFLLTDGTQHAVGLEQTALKELGRDFPAGIKLVVTCPPVCRGMLLLRPDNTRVAGGSVPALEHARRAAVEVWNRPIVGRPRGLPSLAALQAEASAAAWQQHAAGDTAGPTASRQDPVRPESGTAAAPPRRYHTEASLACAPGRGIHASLEGQASGGTAPASSRWAGGQEGRQPLRALNTNRNSVARAAASAESVPAPGCEPRAAGEGGPPPSSSPHTLGGPLTGLPPTPAATLASSHAGPTPSTQGRGTLDDPILVDELEDPEPRASAPRGHTPPPDEVRSPSTAQPTGHSSSAASHLEPATGPSAAGGASQSARPGSGTAEPAGTPPRVSVGSRASPTERNSPPCAAPARAGGWAPPSLAPLEDELLDAATPTLSQILARRLPGTAPGCPDPHGTSGALMADAAGVRAGSGEDDVPTPRLDHARGGGGWGEQGRAPPEFDILGCEQDSWDTALPRPGGGAGPSAPGDAPFRYLSWLASRAASGAPRDFPLRTSVWGMVQRTVGKLAFADPVSGEEQFVMDVVVEDGTMAVTARLGHQFMADFFGTSPSAYESLLSDPACRAEAAGLAKDLTVLLAQYCGLMTVTLSSKDGPLIVEDLPGQLSAAEAGQLLERSAGKGAQSRHRPQ
uniref:RecQ-mediated genome instability protein 1 n=1 Tax=Auxenochlorella protothecoides TaxID=3075 RepID=A0A1D1ZNS7_AUXPR